MLRQIGGCRAQTNPSWELRICQTNTPSARQTLDLWGSDQDGQRQVRSYLSWYPVSKEQSPTGSCNSTTNFSPTPGSPQPSHSGYDSLPKPCAKSFKTSRSPYRGRTADPRAIKHNCRSDTRTNPQRPRTQNPEPRQDRRESRGGIIPYMGCMGTCRGIGYGF